MAYSANNGFNGTTATFDGSGLGDGITNATYTSTNGIVDVSVATDEDNVYVTGMRDQEITLECIGAPGCDAGSTGTVAIAWNSGGSSTFSAICTAASTKGGLNGAITGSASFKPLDSGS